MKYQIDLRSPLKTHMPVTLFMQGDNEANTIEITVTDGSSPASLSGCGAVCYLLRQDGTRVYNAGKISGNTISIPLDSGCYAFPGSYAAFVRLTESATGVKRTILRIAGTIENEGDGPIIDPSGKIPTYEELAIALEKMEAATDAGTQAASNANAAASNANAAASSANASAGEANTAASSANSAAKSIEEMTVDETSVPYGAGVQASLTKNEDTGAYHLAIQAEQGPGYTILGPAYETVEALAAAVPDPSVGDQYNVGDGPPYHIYRWAGMYWEDQGAIQGPKGDTGPGVAPGGTNGQILRKSGEADYETEWGADSVVVYTQAGYDALTTDDRAALYAQGVRLIIVTGNSSGGITISLDADGAATRIGIAAEEVNAIVSNAVSAAKLAIYPVGSIYMSVNATSPAVLFGGTWEQLKDRFLLAAGDAYAEGTTGGEASHTLTVSEMPSHTHTYLDAPHLYSERDNTLNRIICPNGSETTNDMTYATGSAGGGAAHNNMPPYLAVYMWKRTA